MTHKGKTRAEMSAFRAILLLLNNIVMNAKGAFLFIYGVGSAVPLEDNGAKAPEKLGFFNVSSILLGFCLVQLLILKNAPSKQIGCAILKNHGA